MPCNQVLLRFFLKHNPLLPLYYLRIYHRGIVFVGVLPSVLFVNHFSNLQGSRPDALGNLVQLSSFLVHDFQDFLSLPLHRVQYRVHLFLRVVLPQLVDGAIEGFFVGQAAAARLHVPLGVLLENPAAQLARCFCRNRLLKQVLRQDLLKHEALGVIDEGSHDVVGHERGASGNILVFVVLGHYSFHDATDHVVGIQNGSSAQTLGKGFRCCREKAIPGVEGQFSRFVVRVEHAVVFLISAFVVALARILTRCIVFFAKCFSVGLVGFGHHVPIEGYLVALVVYLVQVSEPQDFHSQIVR
mmetsp:Transcript_8022/g.16560  ORF Transcript_8022/g.16560 Transcript_8022/m.16560 type:complete len:300 (-) Transcript_8022:901-1800(-)